MGLGSALGRLKSNLREKTVSALSGHVLKLAGEGSFGPMVAKVYWALKHNGKKVSAALSAALVLVQLAQEAGVCADMGWDCADYAVGVTKLTAFLLASGLLVVDQTIGALDVKPPEKPLELVIAAGEKADLRG